VATRTGVPTSAFCEILETSQDGIPATLQDDAERLSQELLEAACEERLEQLLRVVWEAAEDEERWLQRIRAGLLALLGFLDADPQWAGLLILERPFDETATAACTRRVQAALAEVLDETRGEVIVGAELAPSTELIAELVLTGVFSVIRAHMLKGESRPLVTLTPWLMSSIVEPYLGRGAAKADIARAPAAAAVTQTRAEIVPIRPHRNNMAALRAIASVPRSSNPQIARATGLSSKQTSEAVRLLEERGLIENASRALAPREPNAWLLTAYGNRLLAVITDSFAAASLREQEEALPKRASRRSKTRPGVQPGRAARRAA